VIALAVSLAITELIGRRPYVARDGSIIEVRNFLSARRIEADSIEGVSRRPFRLGKDRCPTLNLAVRKQFAAVAYFGVDDDVVRTELALPRSRRT
jgi:hypothetical protein